MKASARNNKYLTKVFAINIKDLTEVSIRNSKDVNFQLATKKVWDFEPLTLKIHNLKSNLTVPFLVTDLHKTKRKESSPIQNASKFKEKQSDQSYHSP